MNLEQLTQHQLSENEGGAGVYRCYPVSWSIAEGTDKSKSVAIVFRFAVHARWYPDQKVWSDDWAPGIYVDCYSYIGKADGTESPSTIKMLADAGLWFGDFDALLGAPPNIFVLVDVEASEWNGKAQIRGQWINADAPEPVSRGGLKPVDAKVISGLQARFQSKARAIAGAAPAGAAPQPPTPPVGNAGAAPTPTPADTPAQPAAPVVEQPAAPSAPTPQTNAGPPTTSEGEPGAGEIATPF